MTTFLIIIGYLFLCVATYYYCRWLVLQKFPRNFWDWEGVVIYAFLSIFTIMTVMVQTMVYFEVFVKKIKTKKPNWL